MIKTNIFYSNKDIGKNLYRVKTFYKLTSEQDVLANDRDEAEKILNDNGGINHDKLQHITEQKNGVETYFIDTDYLRSHDLEYLGKVLKDDENECLYLSDSTDETIKNINLIIEQRKGKQWT